MDTHTENQIKEIRSQELLSDEELTSYSVEYQEFKTHQATPSQGTLYQIDLPKKALVIKSYPALETLKTIDLYSTLESEDSETEHWEYWGKTEVALTESGRLDTEFSPEEIDHSGLLVLPEGSFLYHPDFHSQFEVFKQSQWWDPRVLKKATDTGPYDLFVSKNHVFVTDRRAGTVLIVCPKTQDALTQLKIRSAGSTNAIHLAVDEKANKAYVTDNESTVLKVIDLTHFQMTSLQPRLGLLGNLCLDHDSRYLYLLTIKPKTSLVYFDTHTFEVIKRVSLDQKLLSEDSDVPVDALSLSLNGTYLILTTYQNEPKPLTSVLNVFNAEKVKKLRTSPLDIEAPWFYGPLTYNPCFSKELDFKGFLIEKGILVESDFTLAPVIEAETIEHSPFVLILGEDEDEEQANIPANIPLSDGAANEIFDILMSTVYQQTGFQLKEHPLECERLFTLSEQLVEALESQSSVVVNRPQFLFNRYDLKTTLHRDAILTLIELRKDLENLVVKTPPVKCPRCTARLLGAWQCTVCGFLLQSPEFIQKRKSSSAEADSFAIPGQILMPLAEQNRVVLLSRDFELLWELKGETLGLKRICDARYFPRKTLLLTDCESHRVLEVNPTGQIVWEIPASFKLQNPIKATFYRDTQGRERILILEPRRIIELDRSFDLLWSYEATSEESQFSDFQRTYQGKFIVTDTGKKKIFEIAPGEEPFEHGSTLDLQDPVYARRLLNNRLLIVDAGRQEIYEQKSNGNLTLKVKYQNEDLGDTFKIATPSFINLQLQGELLLGDSQTLLGIFHTQQKIQWSLALDTLSLNRETLHTETFDAELPKAQEYHVGFLASLPIFQGLGSAAWEALAEALVSYPVSKGSVIVQAGEKASSVFIIVQGEVLVLKTKSSEVLVALHAGDVVGEMALFLQEPRSHTVKAGENSHLLRLDLPAFKKLTLKFPAILKRLKGLAFERKRMQAQRNTYKSRQAIDQLKARMALSKLKRMDLFKNLPHEVFENLYPALQMVSFKRNQTIFKLGEAATYLYIINRGQVSIIDRTDKEISVLGEGDTFGEIALLEGRTRTASTEAKSYSEIYLLHYKDFEILYSEFPELKTRFQNLAKERLVKDEAREALLPEIQVLKSEVFTSVYSILKDSHSFALWNSDAQTPWFHGQNTKVQLNYPNQWSLNGDELLIADTGNHRVVSFDRRTNQMVAEYGDDILSLSFPAAAWQIGREHLLIADQGNQRLIEVRNRHTEDILWEYDDSEWVLSPTWVCETPQHHILWADKELHHVVEINRKKEILWHHGEALIPGSDARHLNAPEFVLRLPSGNTLIADTGNHRVLEVNSKGQTLWAFSQIDMPDFESPCRIQTLPEEQLMIHFDQQMQVVVVSKEKEILTHLKIEAHPSNIA